MALRILVVEDDKHIRRILESLLKADPALTARGGVELTIAEDGKQGLEALAQARFDLVISDLLMPRMDGFAFARELRKHEHGAQVPLIVTSAIYKDQATIERLQADTGAEFFAKPFQVRDLMSAVRRLVGIVEPPRPRDEGGVAGEGELADTSVARLMLDLAEQHATGALVLERGKVQKRIIFLHGTPVVVTSNLRTETLGHFLVARGVLDEARHKEALERAQSHKERIGHVLIEMGVVGEKELLSLLAAQMRAKVTNVLRWKEGRWRFQPGSPPDELLQTAVEAARLVFVGLSKTAHVDEIAQELVRVRGRIGLTLRAERQREPFVRVFGTLGLELLQRRPLLEDVMAAGDPSAMLVQLDALLRSGMAEIEAIAVEKRAQPALTEPPLGHIAQPSAPLSKHPRSLYDELFTDEPSEVRPIPTEPAAEDDEASGVMALPVGPVAAELAAEMEVTPVDPQVEALRTEVLNFFLAIHGKDYYEVLGLGRDAAPEDIAAAYAELGRRFRLERFTGVDLGRDYARLEEIHQLLRQAFETLSSRAERERYDEKLAGRVRPSRASLDADLLAHEASALLLKGDSQGAIEKLQAAVAAAPDQADYQALLGWAVFVSAGGNSKTPQPGVVNAAAHLSRVFIDQALAMNPDSLEAHDYAGRIASAAGDDAQAARHLELVLDADPARADALAAYEAALTRGGDWRRLERQYRKLIHRLGDQKDPERVLRLWWRLAELYRTRLDDKASAKVAYEIAARLAPDDPRPREALARLHAAEPSEWHKAAQALRESIRLAPQDGDAVRSLYRLHVDGQRWDAALAAAGVMAVRGIEDGPAAELLKRFRTRFLQRAMQPLGAELFERIRHPDDDPDLGRLFALLFAQHPPPCTLRDLGVSEEQRVELYPEPFKKVLGYVAHMLSVDPPPVYRRADFGAEAHMGAMRPPVLLSGPNVLLMNDRVGLAFRLGRALTHLLPGRATVAALQSRQLKAVVLAALSLAQPGLKVDDPDGQVAQLRGRYVQTPALRIEAAPLVEKMLKNAHGPLNLTRYQRGVQRTADRVGLLLCNELQAAARLTAENEVPGAVDDLLDFALSQEYVSAKEALGLSIAV